MLRKAMRRFDCLIILIGLFFLFTIAWAQETDKTIKQGKQIYEANCADCHRINGEGLPGTFPALAKNPFIQGNPDRVIETVLKGRKGRSGQMPSWKDSLDNKQVAAVITYIRQAWSNKGSAVTPEMVAKKRK